MYGGRSASEGAERDLLGRHSRPAAAGGGCRRARGGGGGASAERLGGDPGWGPAEGAPLASLVLADPEGFQQVTTEQEFTLLTPLALLSLLPPLPSSFSLSSLRFAVFFFPPETVAAEQKLT